MQNVTALINAIPTFNHPVITDPNEIVKSRFHKHNGIWFDEFGRKAGDTAEELVKKYHLESYKLDADDYYVVDKGLYDAILNMRVIRTIYDNTYIIGIYAGGNTVEDIYNAIG